MRNLKRFMSLFLVVLMLCGMCVPAFADTAGGGTVICVANSASGGSDNTGTGAADKPYLTLDKALAAAKASGAHAEIRLLSNITITKALEIRGADVTIDGGGHTVNYNGSENLGARSAAIVVSDGSKVELDNIGIERPENLNYMGRLLYVAGSDVKLSKATLRFGRVSEANVDDSGSAIHVANGAHVTLDGGTDIFRNETVGKNNAGSVFVANGGVLDVNGAHIHDNKASAKGTGIYVQAGGEMNVYSSGSEIEVLDEIFLEATSQAKAKATVGASAGNSGKIALSRVILDSDTTSAGNIATLDISGETKDASIGVEMADNYHYAYRLVSAESSYTINNTAGEMDETGWTDLCDMFDVRFMTYDGVRGLYLYYHTIDATFEDVSTLTGIKGTDINGNAVSYYNSSDVANTTVSDGVMTIPEIASTDAGDYEIRFTVDEAGKDYRIPTPDQVTVKIGDVTLNKGTDYVYDPDYANGTATLRVLESALSGKTGTLAFKISGEKYAKVTLKMNGPLYTMSTDITGQSVKSNLSVVRLVNGNGAGVDYVVTRDGKPVQGVEVALYPEGTPIGTEGAALNSVTGVDGKAAFTGLDASKAYYYVLYYSDTFDVIARDKISLNLSTLDGQKLSDRCSYESDKVNASYTVTADEDHNNATSVVTGAVADTTVTYYVDMAQDNITFIANQGDATTADTATFHYDGADYREDSMSKSMETSANTYGTLPSIEMVGYVFKGWFTEAEGGIQITSGTAYDTASSPKTLYAHWEPRTDIHFEIRQWVELAEGGTNPRYEDGVTETKILDNGKTYYLWQTDKYDDATADEIRENLDSLKLDSMSSAADDWWTLDGFNSMTDTNCQLLADGTSVYDCYYTRNVYELSFNPTDGAMDGNGNTMDVRYGDDIGPMLTASRSGYHFGGWYWKDGDNESAVTASSYYTWTKDIEVYAKWVNTDTKYSIAIMVEDMDRDPVTGAGYKAGTYTQSTLLKDRPGTSDIEETVTVADVSDLKVDGFTYAGYSLEKHVDGQGFTADAEKYVVTPDEFGTTTIYLYYTRNVSHVSFKDDDTPDAGEHEGKDIVYGDTFGPSLPADPPAKPGYDFDHWVDGNGNVIDGNTEIDGYIKDGSGNLDIIPVWTQRHYYMTYVPGQGVNLDLGAMDGAGSSVNPGVAGGYTVSKEVVYDAAMGTMPMVHKDGYKFLGWKLEDGPAAGSYVTSDTIATVGNVIVKNDDNGKEDTYPLYADYEPYHYTLVLNPGQGGSVDPSRIAIDFDAVVPVLPTPTKTGYTFTGWILNPNDAGGTKVEAGDAWTYLTTNGADIELVAAWQPNRYSYSLNLNDVSNGNGTTKASLFNPNISGVEIEYDGKYAVIVDGVTAQRNGYKFLGWSTSADKSGLITKDTVNTLPENSTLYAIWQPDVINMKVAVNGGAYAADNWFNFTDYAKANYSKYESLYGVKLEASFDESTGAWTVPVIFDTAYGTIGELSRENYKFEGYRVNAASWYQDGTQVLHGQTVKSIDKLYTDATNGRVLELDAVWTPYFDFNLNNANASFESGGSHILKTDLTELPVAKMDGYTFLGWYDDVSNGYVDLAFVKALDEYRAFRAVFTPNVTFNGNGGKIVVDGTEYDSYVIGLQILVDKYGKFFDARLDGKTFMGYKAEDGFDVGVFDNIKARSTPITLNATWDITVTFSMPQNAYWPDNNTKGDRVYPTQQVRDMTTLPVPALYGHIFNHWVDADNNKVTPAGLAEIARSVTVYPVFTWDPAFSQGINVKFTNYAVKAMCATPDMWVEGMNTFTVVSKDPCNAALIRDGKMTRLYFREDGDKYAVDVELQDGDEIIVVMKGDLNLDGRISVADLSVMNQLMSDVTVPSDDENAVKLAANVNGDSRVTVADLSVMNQRMSGTAVFNWDLADKQ